MSPATVLDLALYRETIPRALHPELVVGHAITIRREERAGMVYHVLIDETARRAVQVWEPAERPALALVATPPAESSAAAPPSPVIDSTGMPTAESETPEVAAWVKAQGLFGRVVGAWVWVPDDTAAWDATGGSHETLEALLRPAGFKFSARRQAFFHACGVPAKGRRTGKLDRYHGMATLDTYNPARFDERPEWAVRKENKKIARRKKR